MLPKGLKRLAHAQRETENEKDRERERQREVKVAGRLKNDEEQSHQVRGGRQTPKKRCASECEAKLPELRVERRQKTSSN